MSANIIELGSQEFVYKESEFSSWKRAHDAWWRDRKDPSVWGKFEPQAAGGRCVFSYRNQRSRHFAETLVVNALERDGWVCWTTVRLFHRPGRQFKGVRDRHTRQVSELLALKFGKTPQDARVRESKGATPHFKNIDIVGYHFEKDRWVFCEVKKDKDRLMKAQKDALLFLQRRFGSSADVFVAHVSRNE